MLNTDRLYHLFKYQNQLMERLKIPSLMPGSALNQADDHGEKLLTQHTMPLAFALLDEVHEFVRELNWKPWKKSRKVIDLAKVHAELVDCWFFLLELSIIWGLDAESLFKGYIAKHAENNSRQDKGY